MVEKNGFARKTTRKVSYVALRWIRVPSRAGSMPIPCFLQKPPLKTSLPDTTRMSQLLRSITNYNLSVKTHAFPSDWKHALVTPIFKNRGDKQLPSNYRPVSILPALGKILDNIQSTFLLKYLEEYHQLSNHQFGFRASLSTTKQLSTLLTNGYLI